MRYYQQGEATISPQLLEGLIQRDEDAWAKVYAEIQPYARFWLTSRYRDIVTDMDIEDAIASGFLKAYLHIEKYQITTTPFRSWVFTIIVNHLIDQLRKIRRHTLTLSYDSTNISLDYTPYYALYDSGSNHTYYSYDITEENCVLIIELLATLREEYREAILLRLRGYSYEEIAQSMKASMINVKMFIRRGREQLARKLHTYNDFTHNPYIESYIDK